MTELTYSATLVAVLLASSWAGALLRTRLHGRHTTHDAADSLRLLTGMLLTFAALVLGLLTTNAKQRFDGLNDQLGAFAADLVELDRRLAGYGPDAVDLRGLLRRYTAAALADSWPDEPHPPGDYPRVDHPAGERGIESRVLGDILAELGFGVDRLQPADDLHRAIATQLRTGAATVEQRRWQLIFAARSTLSRPFLLIMGGWLAIAFLTFGLTAPPSRLVHAVAALAAISIAAPVYLIIDYSEALNGALQLSSAPMRVALAHMDGRTAAGAVQP